MLSLVLQQTQLKVILHVATRITHQPCLMLQRTSLANNAWHGLHAAGRERHVQV
jgi:hypothetical protein